MVGEVGKTLAVTTYNTDVHSISRRYNRLLVEFLKSQSSGVSQTMPFDLVRARTYLASIRRYLDYIIGEPLLDCPETGPTEIPLPPKPVIQNLENDSLWDIINLVIIARDELENSQSARLPTNLVRFDYMRQTAVLQKISNLIDYVEAAEPLDLPESTPMQLVTGPGQRGV